LTAFFDVMSIGDLDLDLYISLPTIPGFDQKVGGRNLGRKPGGMSANVAVALARLGRPVRLLAAVGDDAAGQEALAHLIVEGVDLSFVSKRQGASTFMCVVMLSPSGEKSLIKLASDAYLPQLADLLPAAFEGVRHVHATYGAPDVTAKAFEMARDRGLSTSLDLEPSDLARPPQQLARVLSLVNTLFLNREAYSAASDILGATLHPDLLKPPGEIIVTLGAGGCRRIAADGVLEAPGFKVRPVDTTGAGDCFAGAYLACTLEGANPSEGLEFANGAAALATLDFGAQTAMPRREAVEALLRESGGSKRIQASNLGQVNA